MSDWESGAAGAISLARYRMVRTEEIVHAESRALLAYWQRLRAGRRAPYRVEVDPRDMTCQARSLFILEILADGMQRFRLAGSELVETFGIELRGQTARAIMEGRARDSLTALVAETAAEPGIGYARLAPLGGAPDEHWEMLLLPLRSDDGALDRLIGMIQQVSGFRPGGRRAPLRFTIESMWIHPVEATVDEALPAAEGFAEAQAPFAGPAPAGTDQPFRAIDGGRGRNTPAPHRRHPRPSLRVVKDD